MEGIQGLTVEFILPNSEKDTASPVWLREQKMLTRKDLPGKVECINFGMIIKHNNQSQTLS